MSKITLEQVLDEFAYDAATGGIYWKNLEKNPRRKSGPLGYLVDGYVKITFHRRSLWAHRVAWAIHHGEWPELQLDHIDRNRSNNRIENLRLATESQNKMNIVPGRGAIKAKGVGFHKRAGKYTAHIGINRVGKHLGTFDTIDEAAHAYNKAAILYHGEFALLNPIGQDKAAALARKDGEPK